MSDTTYQVYFTSRDDSRECLDQNFYSEREAQESVKQLIDKGFENVTYEGYTFDIALP